jgi:hypothetical protein
MKKKKKRRRRRRRREARLGYVRLKYMVGELF